MDIKYLQEVQNSPKTNSGNYTYTARSSLKSQHVSPEINLLGLTVDEAISIIDKFTPQQKQILTMLKKQMEVLKKASIKLLILILN